MADLQILRIFSPCAPPHWHLWQLDASARTPSLPRSCAVPPLARKNQQVKHTRRWSLLSQTVLVIPSLLTYFLFFCGLYEWTERWVHSLVDMKFGHLGQCLSKVLHTQKTWLQSHITSAASQLWWNQHTANWLETRQLYCMHDLLVTNHTSIILAAIT